jgi:hemolysin D
MTSNRSEPLHGVHREFVQRYTAVLRAAWAARAELAGPRLLAHEAAFLPAALALQHTPPHPAPRRVAAVIFALVAIAVAWSAFRRVDVVAVAPGRLVSAEGRQPVQPLEAAVVKRVLVKDGDRVEAGQALVELDPTTLAADRETVQAQATAAVIDESRAGVLLGALAGGAIPGHDESVVAAWRDLEARRSRLRADARRLAADAAAATAAAQKVEALLPLAREREADMRRLAEQGFLSHHAVQDRTRERIEAERDLATQKLRAEAAEEALREASAAATAFEAEARRALHERLDQARRESERLRPQEGKQAYREGGAILRAPLTGTVQELAVRSAGSVVTPAQTLMVVVPASGGLTLEAMVQNKDIGFVSEGQPVRVKLDAFPFTRYGTVAGRVESISADAVVDERGSGAFRMRVSLESEELSIEGRSVRLSAG